MNYKTMFLQFADKFSPNVRKPKYTNEYFFDNIVNVIEDLQSWRKIKHIYRQDNDHYSTIFIKYKQKKIQMVKKTLLKNVIK